MARTLKCDAIQDPDGSTPNISLTDAVTSFGTLPVDINDGNIDGCTINTSDITVGNSKTLNVQAGTLTTSGPQKDAIVDGSTAISRSSNDLTFAGDIQVNGNTIKDSGGGNTIQMDGSNNVTVLGDLTVTGNDISTASTMNFKPGGTSKMELQTDGDLVVTGDVTAFGTLSDESMKKNINDLEGDAMGKINQLRVVKYEFKPEFQDHEVKKGTQIGLIAQEVEAVFPECVKAKDDGTLTIQYEQLCALLIKGLQEIYTHGVPQETSFDWVRNGTVIVKD